jgi:polyisoprenyl-teichoic acid--peptidoglycan teichoic acid transferase
METAERETGRPRSLLQRLLIAVNGVVIVALLAGVSYAGYLYQRVRDVPRVDFRPGVLGGTDGDEVDEPGEPTNFLLVGDDTREGQDTAAFGPEDEGAGSDTMILVRVEPRDGTAAVLSFPRDLWVTVYDEEGNPTGEQRINTAYGEGGPEGLVNTITENFGIPVHHYIQVDFQGFHDLVEAIDGVTVPLPGPVRDRAPDGTNPSGLVIDHGGCVHLDGPLALAYVRSRGMQFEVDGRWRADGRGDLGRIERQQDFIRRAVDEALASGLTNPVRLNQLVDIARDHVRFDPGLEIRQLVGLGQHFQAVEDDTIDQRSLAVVDDRVPLGRATAFVLRLAQDPAGSEQNEAAFARFRDRAPDPGPAGGDADPGPGDDLPPPDPREVAVTVLNGSGRAGEAGEAAAGLTTAGFAVLATDNAPVPEATTIVRHAPGAEPAATLVARHVAGPGATVELDPSLGTDEIVLTTGTDFTGVAAEPAAGDDTPGAPGDDPATPQQDAPAPPVHQPTESFEPLPADYMDLIAHLDC